MFLHRHPASPPSPAAAIQVVVTRLRPCRLSLVFAVSGEVGRIRLPRSASAERKEGLWRNSCFEAFIRPAGGPGYVELNLAPSGDWAAYAFDSCRSGMRPIDIEAPVIDCRMTDGRLGLVAGITLGVATGLDDIEPWQLNLSAVIESDDGSLSYWALAHPPGAPDFHHPDCFVLELPPAGEA